MESSELSKKPINIFLSSNHSRTPEYGLSSRWLNRPYSLTGLKNEFDTSENSKLDYFPIYSFVSRNFITDPNFSHLKYDRSCFNLMTFPIKHLSGVLRNADINYKVTLREGNFEMGRYFLKDEDDNKILFFGTFHKSLLSNKAEISKASQINKILLTSSFKEKQFPIIFYLDKSLFTNAKYKRLLPEILILLNIFSSSPNYRIILTGDIKSEFFYGFDFPEFIHMEERNKFLDESFAKIIVNHKCSFLEELQKEEQV